MRQCDIIAAAELQREGYELFDNYNLLFEELYSHYLNSGDMPYGVAKARTGDPVEWISEQLESELVYFNGVRTALL